MSPMPKNTRSKAPQINPNSTLAEAINISKAAQGAVKDVNEAKSFLAKEGWTAQGEGETLETLAKVLLAQSLVPKLPVETVNTLTAVAYMITADLQDSVAHGVAHSITELLKHSIATMTVDI